MIITSQNTPNVFSVFLSSVFFCIIVSLMTWVDTQQEIYNLMMFKLIDLIFSVL